MANPNDSFLVKLARLKRAFGLDDAVTCTAKSDLVRAYKPHLLHFGLSEMDFENGAQALESLATFLEVREQLHSAKTKLDIWRELCERRAEYPRGAPQEFETSLHQAELAARAAYEAWKADIELDSLHEGGSRTMAYLEEAEIELEEPLWFQLPISLDEAYGRIRALMQVARRIGLLT